MEFSTRNEAWSLWVSYARKIGFDSRKLDSNKNKDRVVTSTRFLCENLILPSDSRKLDSNKG
jgi:hypothetical protein